jgi:hypothetical protein
MLEQPTRNDPLGNQNRWGYTGDILDDPMPVEESEGPGRWLVWVVLLAVAIIVLIALFGVPGQATPIPAQ